MKTDLFNIQDKVILITGGYGVLGTSISKYLAAQGAKVVVLGRNKIKGDALAKEIKAGGGEALFLESDVMAEEVLIRNREDILKKYGKIDVLINAAGGNMPGATIGPDKNIFDLKLDDFKTVVDLNLFGTALPTSVFAKAMVDGGEGNIVNFSSMSALRPLTRVAGYGAAKAAVSNYTQYMAGELATKFGEKFRVNALAPGFFLTEQNRALLTNPDGSFTDRGKTIIAHTPFRRFGEAEELHGAIHFLVSDASKFVTGTVLVVDGGFNAFSI
ncbi:SDR family oxidoreductase [Dysgonomonas sp. ZJ279]|uniref:SDR family oxidoreductase n=1 Tax=Dysgonomonas sp. ZJ279 TaxID=2709796 RepID=UPI0013EC4B93|nr:SDR family oxidoreductase [Dysgonomonas sp. ZJ279]